MAVAAPWFPLISFKRILQCIPFDEKNTRTWGFATDAALLVIKALNIARGKEFVIPVPSKGILQRKVKVETVQQKELNDIRARMVNDLGEAMKKTQVIKGIHNKFAALTQIDSRRDMLWAEHFTGINDQGTQFSDISLFRDKRKQMIAMIAAERARQSSSNRLDGEEEQLEDRRFRQFCPG